MNVTFRLRDEALEPRFLEQAAAAGLAGLKGHRSVGGIRASIYNAFPEAGVTALVDFMAEFERSTADPREEKRRQRAWQRRSAGKAVGTGESRIGPGSERRGKPRRR